MRTTLTLDEDVAAKLTQEARRNGRSFKDVVNDTLRRGLLSATDRATPAAFVVRSSPLGLRAGLSFETVEAFIDEVDGKRR